MSDTNALRPAWSAAFAADALASLRPVPLLDDLTQDWAWGGSTGRGVKVAIIDSGIDADHPAVGVVQGYVAIREERGKLVYDEKPHRDAYGHGNACAGIIRALAPECEIYSVKVLGDDLTGRGIIFATGIQWALENGMDVCNLSLGSTKAEFFGVLHELADLAYFRHIPLVVAANNLPKPSYPSTYAAVVSVAAHEVPEPERFYYNPAPPVEFGARGIDVPVAWMDGGTITATGNSFATPHVTGFIARLLAKHPGLTVFQVKTVLRALAANVDRERRATEAH
ncbi:MAG: S8 family serine peptidase [Chloroflexia bacterium]|nr:S8 family serine peptidase [Chloroflexia bacterium]